MRYLLIYFLVIGLWYNALAQQSGVLQNNPSLKWYQLNTPHFKVIYPKGFEIQANRMANTLEHIREPEARTMGEMPSKISIVLQNQSAISNGFVSVLPRRSEFYAMPSQNYNFQGNNDWLDLLATHEYRHMAQYQHAKRGFTKLLFYLFGNNGLSALSYVSAPAWFWEGDAVAVETAFTSSGRGRIPNFDLLFKTNLLEGRTFNYHKQYLRSYKHNIPDHYVLGYHMVSYLRRRTGNPEIWENISSRAWSNSIIPFTFSNAIKKESGLYVKELYRAMVDSLKKDWTAQLDTLKLSDYTAVNTRNSNAYIDYRYPFQIQGDSILVMKSGIGEIEQFVLMTGEKQKRIFTPGPINSSGMISYANKRLVWNEYRFDPRFPVHTYSVVMAYDLETKFPKQLTRNSRYAGAAISHDGARVATVETSTDYQTNLVVLDYASGDVLKKFENPANNFISMPRWNEAGTEIIALMVDRNGKKLSSINFETSEVNILHDFGDENIGYPVPYKNFVLYNSPLSGIDNIYALDRNTGVRYQITTSRLGAYNPCVSDDGLTLYYNEQQRDGMDVVKTSFNPATWKQVPLKAKQPDKLFQHLVEQEGQPDLLKDVPSVNYTPTRYSQLKNMFNIYSWGAYAYNDLAQVNVGISSQDVLSTTALNVGYVYDLNERSSSWKAGISYQKFFPIIDFQVAKSDRISDQGNLTYRVINGTDTTRVTENLTFKWNESTIESGIRIPLNTTSSRYQSNVTFSNYVGYTRINEFENSIDGGGRLLPIARPQYFFRDFADQGTLIYNRFGLSAYRLLKQSRRDINSKWGQAIFINLYGTPYGGDYDGSQFSFQGRMFFPGLFKHHSLWGYYAYQSSEIADVFLSSGQGLDNYTFRNSIPLPRGQSVSRFENFYSMSANYTLPLWYPDISIGPLLNLQRIRANLFFDYGFGSSNVNQDPSQRTYTSTGAEVTFDINVFRLLPQFDIGFRYSYGISPAATRFELLIGSLNF
jgi:hypothetical protein